MTSLAKNLLFFLPKVFSPGPLTHGERGCVAPDVARRF